tara:strand:+ start:1288 stop:3078 length:1791 start_codon:yes stop_codon:yes gene_type:complete
MADSKIFKYANNITYNRNTTSARSITTGGYARTHRTGPTLYNMKAELPILTKEQYDEVEGELFQMEDGIQFLTANISSNNGNNIMSKATVPLKSGETSIKIVKQDYSKLNQFTLCNLEPNNNSIFKVGDFIQFDNNDKVYQIYKPVGQTGTNFKTSNAGTTRVRLSSPVLSNLGLSTNTSTGRTETYYLVSGKADQSEQVSYDWASTNTNPQVGKIIFKNSNTGNQYLYADGTAAELNIWQNYYWTTEIKSIANGGIAGNDSNSSLSQAQKDQNNKLGQILNTVTSTGSNASGVLTWDFLVPDVIAELTITSADSQSMTNETVLTTITTPYQSGLMTIKNSDGITTTTDANGDDLTINLPSSLFDVEDIYNYLTTTIMASNSTHPIKTQGVWTSISSGNFTEYWGETDLDHVGTFNIIWGPEYDGCTIKFTTPVGPVAVNYNNYTILDDKVSNLITNGIEIENSYHTYTAAEFIQPTWALPGISYTKKILSVSVNGTTTTINFDTTFSSGTSGWYDTGTNTGFAKHQNDVLSTATNVLYPMKFTSGTLYKSNVNVKTGSEVNMKLMLNKKPAVTIIPRNESENLYKYDAFEFMEVL